MDRTPQPATPPAASTGGEPLRRYANHFDVQFSISEVDLRFGQSFGSEGGGTPAVHSWLVTTPVHLVALGRVVNAAIASYRDRFGPIPDAGDPEGPRG